jgi:hypothetical protein
MYESNGNILKINLKTVFSIKNTLFDFKFFKQLIHPNLF